MTEREKIALLKKHVMFKETLRLLLEEKETEITAIKGRKEEARSIDMWL